jgi:hypothetical protein
MINSLHFQEFFYKKNKFSAVTPDPHRVFGRRRISGSRPEPRQWLDGCVRPRQGQVFIKINDNKG